MTLNEQRLDYAWKWFNFHADQRTKMFNFMLVGMGLIASALVAALDKEFTTLARVLGIAGFGLALAFWRIDQRNKQLYEAALDVLFDLEQFHLFSKDGTFTPRHDGKPVPFAIGWRVHQDDRAGGREPSVALQWWQGRHRRLMPAIILGLGLVFLLVGLDAWQLSQRAERATRVELVMPGGGTSGPADALPATPAPPPQAGGSGVPALPPEAGPLPDTLPVTVAPQPGTPIWLLLAAGLALMGLGAYTLSRGGRSLGVTQLAVGTLLSTAGALGVTFKGEVKFDPTVQLRLIDKVDARIRLQLGAKGAPPRLLGSHRFEGFASGASTLACPAGEALDALRARVQNMPKDEDLVVLAVGGTDRDPLRPGLRHQLESNTGLARARVDTAVKCLALAPPAGTAQRVLPLVTGPAYTPQQDASRQAAAQAMQADRAVDLHVLAVPRGVSSTR